jgi:hypothetical protein
MQSGGPLNFLEFIQGFAGNYNQPIMYRFPRQLPAFYKLAHALNRQIKLTGRLSDRGILVV